MNIQQAIKSGKKIRRKEWTGWGLLKYSIFSEFNNLIEADILADDWEIEQVAVTITSQQFWDAYAEYVESQNSFNCHYGELISYMAEQLGLEVEIGFGGAGAPAVQK